ncbi:hypothetical protein OHB26_01520 [Nocardia sp. NBC_01503]|uniref:hypothetical protein n=1 Tax=Nocardia sp. NBC_01503 TaxID=2975997 RepID=UPI002E7AE291|nr:hypothetical protein [Nocardia sp. NBC_01503]WTL32964.1 hypothetical protein OHB26_01520 [Nocardia sp. NBC_01503]
MEFYGPRLERLEDCDVRDDDIEMNAAEALEALILHRDCHAAVCPRQQAATRIIGIEKDRYAEPSNVIPLPTRHFKVVGQARSNRSQ